MTKRSADQAFPVVEPKLLSCVGMQWRNDAKVQSHEWSNSKDYYLKRDTNNEYDAQALQVCVREDDGSSLHLGFLARQHAAYMAPLLDADRCIVLNGPVDSSASKATFKFEWIDVTDMLGP